MRRQPPPSMILSHVVDRELRVVELRLPTFIAVCGVCAIAKQLGWMSLSPDDLLHTDVVQAVEAVAMVVFTGDWQAKYTPNFADVVNRVSAIDNTRWFAKHWDVQVYWLPVVVDASQILLSKVDAARLTQRKGLQ